MVQRQDIKENETDNTSPKMEINKTYFLTVNTIIMFICIENCRKYFRIHNCYKIFALLLATATVRQKLMK